MQYKRIIAIDPGANGGVAEFCEGWPKPRLYGLKGLGEFLRLMSIDPQPAETLVVMELVGGFIAGRPAPGSAMFNFGRGFGQIEGAVQALGIRLELVRPQEWQKALRLGDKGKGPNAGAEWKRKLRDEAQRRYPGIDVITLKTADALLILDWVLTCRKEQAAHA